MARHDTGGRGRPGMMRSYATAEALAEALAQDVAAALAAQLKRDGAATLAVSGGTTPMRFFQALSGRDIAWAGVTISLVDERWVGPASPRSNAALVRTHLLKGRAAAARFVPMYNNAATPEGADFTLPRPLTAVVLGMGLDGHTASFFPGGDNLGKALDPAGTALALPMRAPAAGEARLTLTLPVLLEARYLALHIEGEPKRAVLAHALEQGEVAAMPVRAVLSARPDTEIFWSP